MKHIVAPLISGLDIISAKEAISTELRLHGAKGKIDSINWPEIAAYAPKAEFFIAHSGKNIYVLFENTGRGLKAVNYKNQSPVSQDSCVEFFVQPDINSPRYWNFEFNAIGAVNASNRIERPQPTRLSDNEIGEIKRFPSVGSDAFDEIDGIQSWDLLVTIPLELIGVKFNDSPIEMKANFLKCGSKTKHPHYLSWSPIKTDSPDFHQISYFGGLVLDS